MGRNSTKSKTQRSCRCGRLGKSRKPKGSWHGRNAMEIKNLSGRAKVTAKFQLSQNIRNILRSNSHGMSVVGITEMTKASDSSVRRSLKSMPDAYISEWVLTPANGRFTAVWRVVVPPPNAPEPDENHPRFKPINPFWQIDLRKNNGWKNRLLAEERKKSVKSVKSVKDDAKAASKPSGPKLTRWVPVKPWPKGVQP